MLDIPPPQTITSGSRILTKELKALAVLSKYTFIISFASSFPFLYRSTTSLDDFLNLVLNSYQLSNPGPDKNTSIAPTLPQCLFKDFSYSSIGPGIGFCPHSPVNLFGPTTSCLLTTYPAPTPVPKITANTELKSFPAPSIASDKARQSASLAIFTSKPSFSSKSFFTFCPSRAFVFDTCTNPVFG